MPEDPNEGNNLSDERPEWLPEKFKSPEDLARSYAEAENKIREQGAQLNAMNENFATLSEQLEELQATQQSYQQPQPQQSDWNAMYEENPVGTMALLAQQMADAKIREFQQQFSQQLQPTNDAQSEIVLSYADAQARALHPDWDEIKDEVADFIKSDPTLPDDNDPRWNSPQFIAAVYDRSARLVKASKPVDPTQQSARDMKLAAQGLTAGGSGRPDPANDAAEAWDRIRGAGGGDYASLISPRS